MIKLETHCHIYDTSSCADTPNDLILSKYIDGGYGGIVVTNHFCRNSYQNYMKGETHEQKVDSFFKEIDNFKMLCEKVKLKCFWGVEVRTCSGVEYAVIGLPRKVFYERPMFEYSQEELFCLAQKYNAFMYQTHPFRQGVQVGNPKFMHGAERFNGHYHHYNNNDKAEQFCLENKLIGLSGTDLHHIDQPVTAGIFAPKTLQTNDDLVKFLFDDNFQIVKDEETYLTELKRYRGE